MPAPRTAIVGPDQTRAPRWAAASMPNAPPATTVTPRSASPIARSVATLMPYAVAAREPTTPPHRAGQQGVEVSATPRTHRHKGVATPASRSPSGHCGSSGMSTWAPAVCVGQAKLAGPVQVLAVQHLTMGGAGEARSGGYPRQTRSLAGKRPSRAFECGDRSDRGYLVSTTTGLAWWVSAASTMRASRGSSITTCLHIGWADVVVVGSPIAMRVGLWVWVLVDNWWGQTRI